MPLYLLLTPRPAEIWLVTAFRKADRQLLTSTPFLAGLYITRKGYIHHTYAYIHITVLFQYNRASKFTKQRLRDAVIGYSTLYWLLLRTLQEGTKIVPIGLALYKGEHIKHLVLCA